MAGYQSLKDPYPDRLDSHLSADKPGYDLSLRNQFDEFQVTAKYAPSALLSTAHSYQDKCLAARFVCDAAEVLHIDQCSSVEKADEVMVLARQRASGLLQYSE